MVRFTDSNVVVEDYPSRQRDNPSRNGRWSPDYHYAGGAAPPSPGGSGGPYMTGPIPASPAPSAGYSTTTQAPPRYADDSPSSPVLTRENSLQVPHWDRYRPRSVPPPLSPTTDASTMVFPPARSRSRNHDRDRETYHDRERDRHDDRSSRRKGDRETKGRRRDRYYDSESSSSDDERKGNKPAITRSRTPLSKARQALSSTFSDSTTGLGAGVIGAIVGGLAAREASENLLAKQGGGHGHGGHGHHSGKEALLSTIAGAAVGALGANAIEKRIEASRKKSSSSSSATSPTAASGKGSDDGKNYTWSDERRRSSLTEEKKSGRDRDRERNRDLETYRDRDIRRDRSSQRRGSNSKEEYRYRISDDDDDEIVYDHRRRRSQRDRSRSRSRRDDDDWRGSR